jgi:protein gp37
MSDKSRIEWTDATWNVVTGCHKLRPGCANCYAERDWKRVASNPNTVYYNRAFTDVQCHPERLSMPFHWKRPRRIFVNSMSDLFEASVPDDFIDHTFAAMVAAPQHIYQVLTKRDKRMQEYMSFDGRGAYIEGRAKQLLREWGKPVLSGKFLLFPIRNVWLGVSCETQKVADECTKRLVNTPANHRFISFEPLLEHIDPQLDGIDWVVAGGESGSKARPCDVEWLRFIAKKCKAAHVPFCLKQLGAYVVDSSNGQYEWPHHVSPKDPVDIYGRLIPGSPCRMLLGHCKGAEPSEWRADLQDMRQMPEVSNAKW